MPESHSIMKPGVIALVDNSNDIDVDEQPSAATKQWQTLKLYCKGDYLFMSDLL